MSGIEDRPDYRRLELLKQRARQRANNLPWYPDIDHEAVFRAWLVVNDPTG